MIKRGILVLLLASGIAACTKSGDVKPILTVGNLSKDASAGEPVQFDLNATGSNPVKGLKVSAEYQGIKKTVTDTTFPSPYKVFQYEYFYTIPADAKKNDSIPMTFTITDTKGNMSTSSKTIVVKGAQPVIQLTASDNSASAGSSVSLHAIVNSSSNDLGNAELTESINNATPTSLDTKTWQNQNYVTWDYVYTLPSGLKAGDKIDITLIVTNADNVQRAKTVTITVK